MPQFKLLGILGGTFDPIHNGHLAIVHSLENALPFEHIQLIPCKVPPHRIQPLANPTHRLKMLQLAVKGQPKLVINEIELNRPGPSYTVDTLRQLNSEWPHHALCLIMGMDALLQLNRWHQWPDILQLAHIIAVNRPNYELTQEDWLKAVLKTHQIAEWKQLTANRNGKIFFHNIPPQTTSATKIRDLLQRYQSIIPEVPESVGRYIKEHHLYNLS